MAFGVGFVTGGVVAGLALSRMTIIHGFLEKLETSAKKKTLSARQATSSKL